MLNVFCNESERGNDVIASELQNLFDLNGRNKKGTALYWEYPKRKSNKCTLVYKQDISLNIANL